MLEIKYSDEDSICESENSDFESESDPDYDVPIPDHHQQSNEEELYDVPPTNDHRQEKIFQKTDSAFPSLSVAYPPKPSPVRASFIEMATVQDFPDGYQRKDVIILN